MEKIKQFIKFGIVGCSNTIISYIIYLLTLFVLKPFSLPWDYFVGNIISFLISVLWSFYWNEHFVFQVQNRTKTERFKSLLKTYISYGFSGLILSNILSWVWVSMLGVDKKIAPIINLSITIPVNFLLNKLWSFKE